MIVFDTRRLERTEAAGTAESALAWQRLRPEAGVAVERIAGGTAVYFGAGSPLSQAVHVGLDGPVEAAEFDRLEKFFLERGCAATISLCPEADPTLVGHMAARGYRLMHFEHTLARAVSGDARVPSGVRHARAGEGAVWARTILEGFSDGAPVLDDGSLEALFNPESCFLAEAGGIVAGGAAAFLHDRAVLLAGDATLPAFRGRGIQLALIAARLALARERGCDLAMACTLPGSISQRNYQRAGFQIVYTKALMVRQA
ncbi:MAG: GNAT family N-acetyltransferase [Bryobacteraceae bacterium]